jgi:hypothetical protein
MSNPFTRHGTTIAAALAAALFASTASAQPGTDDVAADDREMPTAARRAHEWSPDPDATGGPAWFASASPTIVFFSGDDAVDTDAGFGAQFRVGRRLAGNSYVVGSYLVAFAEAEAADPFDDSSDEEDFVLHIPTIGVGVRADVSPEVYVFIEPCIGGVFGSDVDAGAAVGASTGVEIELQPGFAVRVSFSGMFTDSSFDTSAGDADLDAVWSVGVGLAFQF